MATVKSVDELSASDRQLVDQSIEVNLGTLRRAVRSARSPAVAEVYAKMVRELEALQIRFR